MLLNTVFTVAYSQWFPISGSFKGSQDKSGREIKKRQKNKALIQMCLCFHFFSVCL